MKRPTDQDGKSKTASAVDESAYPEQDQDNDTTRVKTAKGAPSVEEIRARAHELWVQRGRPSGTADQDWADAEQQLQEAAESRVDLEQQRHKSGSVQR